MRSTLVFVFAFVLLVSAGPAAAHGNHLSVDDQYADDGAVVVETVFTSSDGFLVLHADDNGEPGEPIGHTPIESGFATGVTVNVSDEYRGTQNGQRAVWAVLHLDDGDGKFEPGRDAPVPAFGGEAEKRFTVDTRSAGPASVVVSDIDSQETNGTVVIDRAALGKTGALVVRADRNGEPGPVVGRTSLDAGVHENVAVELDESYYRNQDSRFGLWATLDERGSPVTVDGAPIASEFGVRKVENAPSQTASARAGEDTGPASQSGAAEGSGVEGLGFGVGVAILATIVAATTVLVRSRRR